VYKDDRSQNETKTWRSTFEEDLVDREESIETASGLWLQTGADGEPLLPIVLSRTGGSKC